MMTHDFSAVHILLLCFQAYSCYPRFLVLGPFMYQAFELMNVISQLITLIHLFKGDHSVSTVCISLLFPYYQLILYLQCCLLSLLNLFCTLALSLHVVEITFSVKYLISSVHAGQPLGILLMVFFLGSYDMWLL